MLKLAKYAIKSTKGNQVKIERARLSDYFFFLSAFIVIVAGLYNASDIVVIFILAIFIATILSALIGYLQTYKIPKLISYLVAFVIILAFILFIAYIMGSSLSSFLGNIPSYESKLKSLLASSIMYLNGFDLNIDPQEVSKLINFDDFVSVGTGLLGNLSSLASKALLVAIGIGFILSEAKSFEDKLKIVFSTDDRQIENFNEFSHNIQQYFIVKTLTSFLTGVLVFFTVYFFGIEYPFLWAIIAFLFNFIPVVGSIIAAAPALLLSLTNGGVEPTLWLMVCYFLVNISISNALEPKLMGDELGLSPMVIFFSLIFWGWVLGIAGAFLAVPITMSLKIACESSSKTQWLALLLSNVSRMNKSNN